jgi:hypothetical protein
MVYFKAFALAVILGTGYIYVASFAVERRVDDVKTMYIERIDSINRQHKKQLDQCMEKLFDCKNKSRVK